MTHLHLVKASELGEPISAADLASGPDYETVTAEDLLGPPSEDW